jgi:peptidoglycan glycosyltransferase
VNAPLRKVGVVVLVLFGLLFANLNYVQAYKANDYRTNDHNGRVALAEYERERGAITLSHGYVLARSKPTSGALKYQRTYSDGAEAYAHIVGYRPVNAPATGIEKLENDFLSGNSDALFGDRFTEMFSDQKKPGGNVILSLSKQAQETAYDQLLHNKVGADIGAVVALDPRTGAVLAAAATPSYDPTPLVSHDGATARNAFEKLDSAPDNPLLNRAFSDTYPPGSTFKVIDAATALSNGITPDTVLTGGSSYGPPGTTHVIHNAPGVVCPDKITLKQALTVSCNTAFSRLCVEKLGADKVKAMAQDFGYESAPTIARDSHNVFNVVPSHTGDMTGPDGQVDKPTLALSCIGQSDVRMTPLQGALQAAAVANGGDEMRPYLVDTLQAPDLSAVYKATPSRLHHVLSGEVAGQLRDMMINVVENGTGRRAQIDGFQVGGKTGTAETGGSQGDHGWFTGFVLKDGQPVAAVAVFLDHAGAGGSAEASRIGGVVMRAVLESKGMR